MKTLFPGPIPPGVRPLEHWLGTAALANLAMLDRACILSGQPEPSRASKGQRSFSSGFYGDKPMAGGLMGHCHAQMELATVLQGRVNFGVGQRLYEAQTGARQGVLHSRSEHQ